MADSIDEKARRSKEALAARRAAQAADGRLAALEYHHAQMAAVDRIAGLKAQRLARDAAAAIAKSNDKKSNDKKSKDRKAGKRPVAAARVTKQPVMGQR